MLFGGMANNSEEETAPAGVGVSSFTAEATAAEIALIKVRERVMRGWRGRIRILTDSRSLLGSLQTPLGRQEQRVRAVSKFWEKKLPTVHVIWCGSEATAESLP